MQAQQHGDLSTMPAANHESGRVQTMFEENDQEGQNNTSNNNPEEIEDFNEMAALLEKSAAPTNIKRGDVVEGVSVRIDQDEILVDIGLKSEGVLSTKELPASGYGSFNELHLNDRVLVYIIQPESSEGHAILSLKRANTERQWRIAEDQFKNGELLKARVIDYNKGGLIVDVAGIDRKSTRLNSSHGYISYAVFCLKKKKKIKEITTVVIIVRDSYFNVLLCSDALRSVYSQITPHSVHATADSRIVLELSNTTLLVDIGH